jgi:hypothetical protein
MAGTTTSDGIVHALAVGGHCSTAVNTVDGHRPVSFGRVLDAGHGKYIFLVQNWYGM